MSYKQQVKNPCFAKTADEARLLFGDDYKVIEVIDPGGKLSISKGATNPFGNAQQPLYARPGIAGRTKENFYANGRQRNAGPNV